MFNRGVIGGFPGVDAVNTDVAYDAVNRNSYDFGRAMDIGDANTNRMVVVAGTMRFDLAADPAPTVTIGGSAATVVAVESSFVTSFIAYLKVASGTTANVVVTRSDAAYTPYQCGIAVFALNTTESAADDTSTDAALSGTLSASLTVFNRGAVIYAYTQNGTGASSTAWSGTETVEDVVDATSETVRRTMGKVDIEEDSTSNLTCATNGNASILAAASFIF